jgi:hypothetical protein
MLAGILGERRATFFMPIAMIVFAVMMFRAFSHGAPVRFIADDPQAARFGSRHRRRIEVPFPAAETFDMADSAIRELPFVEAVESVRDSLQIHARGATARPADRQGRDSPHTAASAGRNNLVHATIAPGESIGSLTLICEPEGGAWVDLVHVDDGTNFENVEAITRAISRRIAERRKEEAASARYRDRQGARGGEAQPPARAGRAALLYNTLASAQLAHAQRPAQGRPHARATSSPICAHRCRAPSIRCRRWARSSSARRLTWRSCASGWATGSTCRSRCPSR